VLCHFLNHRVIRIVTLFIRGEALNSLIMGSLLFIIGSRTTLNSRIRLEFCNSVVIVVLLKKLLR
jgi:hypothetical protein